MRSMKTNYSDSFSGLRSQFVPGCSCEMTDLSINDSKQRKIEATKKCQLYYKYFN